MPVDVARKPVTSPVEKIVVSDDLDDKLAFTPNHGSRGGLQARVHVGDGRDPHVRISFADARSLAAALVEWADAVEA